MRPALSFATTGLLDLGYEASGDPAGPPVVLLHGFPYDVRAMDGSAARLADRGARVIVPYLRGYGPTRFRDPGTLRSGQQAALGHDLLELIDALQLDRPVVAGYDWGGRAACIVAALWPDRVSGLVSVGGYNIQDIASADQPSSPAVERSYWYQYYFHSERGRLALEQNREELLEFLWRDWSPTWPAAAAEFRMSAQSFGNPDFVEVVIHSYRHRFGIAAGDPQYEETELLLAAGPAIGVPTVALHGADDGVGEPALSSERERFTSRYDSRVLPGVGHNLPQEAPEEFASAVASLLQ
jgi:pimeloyl-ACP methyl ester carboxylesterase